MADAPKVYTGEDGKQVRVWTCDVCRKHFEWDDRSEWYGSELDFENHDWHKVLVVCSGECRVAVKVSGVPA